MGAEQSSALLALKILAKNGIDNILECALKRVRRLEFKLFARHESDSVLPLNKKKLQFKKLEIKKDKIL